MEACEPPNIYCSYCDGFCTCYDTEIYVYNFIVNIRNNKQESIMIFIAATEYYKLQRYKYGNISLNIFKTISNKIESKKKYIRNTGKLLNKKLSNCIRDKYLINHIISFIM